MGTADVRFGSKADMARSNFDVRFTPESGHCRRKMNVCFGPIREERHCSKILQWRAPNPKIAVE
jgi:hypothetical protein